MKMKEKFINFINKIKENKKLKKENVTVKDNNKNKIGGVYNLFKSGNFVDIGDKSRVDIKVMQSLSFISLSMIVIIIMLVLLIIVILPLKEVKPFFVHFMPKEEQIVYVENYKQGAKSQRAVKEFIARDYVKSRETVDLISEEERYNKIKFLSTNEVKNNFYNEYHPDKNANSPYKEMVDKKALRYINITRSSVLNDNQYQVEFVITDSLRATGRIIQTQIALATITFIETKIPSKGQDYLNNPFGYLVSDYSVGIIDKKIYEIKGDSGVNNEKNKKSDNNADSDSKFSNW